MKLKIFIVLLSVTLLLPVAAFAVPACNELTDLSSSMGSVESFDGVNYHYSLTFSNTTINPACSGYGIEEVDIIYNSSDPSFTHEALPFGWEGGSGPGSNWEMSGGIAPASVPAADLVHIILPGASLSGFKFYSNLQLTGRSSFDYQAFFRIPVSVPEPGTVILLWTGLAAMSLYGCFRLKRTGQRDTEVI